MNSQVQSTEKSQFSELPAVQGATRDERLVELARQLNCMLETDLMLLGKLSHSTVTAWRKRGQGPAYILLGNRYLYPIQAVAEFLEGQVRSRSNLGKEAIL